LAYDLFMGIATAEVRTRAITAYAAGNGSQAEIAKCYGVDIATFQRWLQRFRQTGRVAPFPRGHNPPALDEVQTSELSRLVHEKPDATLEQLRESLGVTCSLVAIHNTLKRLGYRFKKNSTGQRTRTPGYQRTS
jgi:transposase